MTKRLHRTSKPRSRGALKGGSAEASHSSSFGSALGRAFRGTIVRSILATVLFAAVFLITTKAWKFSIYSPLVYWGDALEMASYLGRDYVFNDLRERFFAPFGIEHASPLRYLANGLFQPNAALFQLAYFVTRDVVGALNVYYLTTFPLVFLSAYWVYGRLRLSDPFRFGAAALYALMPYHFERNVGHLMESSYFLVPVLAYILLLVCTARPFFHTWVHGAWRLTWRQTRDWVFLCVMVFLSSINEYHQLFFMMLLSIAGLISCVRHRNPRILLGAVILLGGAGLSIVARVVLNDLAAEPGLGRSLIGAPISAYGGAERFGLKIVQILLPVNGHHSAFFQTICGTYNAAHEVNENSTTALGLFGAIGFVCLIALGVFSIAARARKVTILDICSLLVLGCVLIATIGGISSVVATASAVLLGPESILTQVRCYNRIIVFIAFFSYFAASVLTARFAVLIANRARHSLREPIVTAIWLPIFVFALWDQVPFKLTNSPDDTARFVSDKKFFGRIESQLTPHSMLFQYPYNIHHANLSNSGAPPYNYADGLRPYLNTRTLRFTYGGDSGSAQADWLRDTSALAPGTMISRLCEYGFEGVIIHRKLFQEPKLAAAFEAQVQAVLNVPPEESADGDFSFFRFSAFCASNHIPKRNLDEEGKKGLLDPARIRSAQKISQFVSVVRVVPDPTAPHLVGIFDSETAALVARKGEKGWLLYGPNVKLLPGDYQAVFTITIEAADPGIEVGIVDVTRSTSPSQASEVASAVLQSAAGQQLVAVKFRVTPSDLSPYQFRVFVNGAAERFAVRGVAVDKISD